MNVDFPQMSVSPEDASYSLQVLTNALWYITNDHLTINEASQRFRYLWRFNFTLDTTT